MYDSAPDTRIDSNHRRRQDNSLGSQISPPVMNTGNDYFVRDLHLSDSNDSQSKPVPTVSEDSLAALDPDRNWQADHNEEDQFEANLFLKPSGEQP
jgi:hypothetical protein